MDIVQQPNNSKIAWSLRYGHSPGIQSKGKVRRRSRYQATTGEDTAEREYLVRAVVNC
jgi:hypothetical protein